MSQFLKGYLKDFVKSGIKIHLCETVLVSMHCNTGFKIREINYNLWMYSDDFFFLERKEKINKHVEEEIKDHIY